MAHSAWRQAALQSASSGLNTIQSYGINRRRSASNSLSWFLVSLSSPRRRTNVDCYLNSDYKWPAVYFYFLSLSTCSRCSSTIYDFRRERSVTFHLKQNCSIEKNELPFNYNGRQVLAQEEFINAACKLPFCRQTFRTLIAAITSSWPRQRVQEHYPPTPPVLCSACYYYLTLNLEQ